jgi:Protein of unknown function (DUF4038)/Domain of unknown function (DUF5060)/Putative collagen-binding domain of a collagenase
MPANPTTIPRRTVGEWALRSDRSYAEPFADVAVEAIFTGPSGQTVAIPAFHDGTDDEGQVWRVRFNPNEAGRWTYRTVATPHDDGLTAEGSIEVTDTGPVRGFLRATPGEGWGLTYESGEPCFVFGDTLYNLFGMAHCGLDVEGLLRRRAAQGFNFLRLRIPVSPFHPPDGYNQWQTARTWAWGGSEQAPRFDRFNLDYFRTVDRVVALAEELGLGLELIMEAWGFEFPFGARQIFVAEWEELWLRYLIARYDAYTCVACWTLANEYEYYPNGDWHYKPVADRWAMRAGRLVKRIAGHGHIVAVHNGPRQPPFARRFVADPGAIDLLLFQDWGTRDEANGWLAAGIEDQIDGALDGWWGAAIFSEWGYERNPDLPLLMPSHEWCDVEHTRRGAWRGAFRALGIIHGFENSWGPFALLDRDQPGLADLLQVRHFFTEVVPFASLRRAPDLIPAHNAPPGHAPAALATPERDIITIYLPTGGEVVPTLPPSRTYVARWFDPRTADLRIATPFSDTYRAPTGTDTNGHPHDWVLLLTSDE